MNAQCFWGLLQWPQISSIIVFNIIVFNFKGENELTSPTTSMHCFLNDQTLVRPAKMQEETQTEHPETCEGKSCP